MYSHSEESQGEILDNMLEKLREEDKRKQCTIQSVYNINRHQDGPIRLAMLHIIAKDLAGRLDISIPLTIYMPSEKPVNLDIPATEKQFSDVFHKGDLQRIISSAVDFLCRLPSDDDQAYIADIHDNNIVEEFQPMFEEQE